MKNLLALLIFGSGLAGWYFYQQHTKAKTELAELTRNMDSYQQAVNQRQSEYQALTQTAELQRKILSSQNELIAIQDKERALKDRITALGKQRVETILAARQGVAGRIFPELTLTDGRKLAQVKVLKADDSGLSVSLPSGIQKLSPSELPQDLRQNLHYK